MTTADLKPGATAPSTDAAIFTRIAELKAAWETDGFGDDKAGEAALAAHLAGKFNGPEMELQGMRPSTVAGALAKVGFYRWYADAAGADEPFKWGMEVAAADLTAIDAGQDRNRGRDMAGSSVAEALNNAAKAPDSNDVCNALADLDGIGHLLLDLSKRDEDECEVHPRTLYFLADSIIRFVRTVEGYAFPAAAASRRAAA